MRKTSKDTRAPLVRHYTLAVVVQQRRRQGTYAGFQPICFTLLNFLEITKLAFTVMLNHRKRVGGDANRFARIGRRG